MLIRIAITAVALTFGASLSHASIIFSDPGTGATTTFSATGLTQGAGPFVVNGFSITGQSNVAFGDAPYGLGPNGSWTGLTWVGTNSGTGSITIDLGALYSLVGGLMNYSPGSGADATITALAADGTTVLESYDLVTTLGAAISTPGATDAGAFRGISRGTADIRFLVLSGDFILTHTLEVGPSTVPEPTTFVLSGLGLAAAGLFRLRKRSLGK